MTHEIGRVRQEKLNCTEKSQDDYNKILDGIFISLGEYGDQSKNNAQANMVAETQLNYVRSVPALLLVK